MLLKLSRLLDIMLKTMRCKIQNEIKEAGFVAAITDDVTDVSNHFQNVVMFRYIVSGKVVERSDPSVTCHKVMLKLYLQMLLNCLSSILPSTHDKQKLVA